MLETYSIVEVQMAKAEKEVEGKKGPFDPYKLLHMPADGTFGTEEIEYNFERLAEKYHPSRVNREKVPYVKALRRWENLQLAHKTLTDIKMFKNW